MRKNKDILFAIRVDKRIGDALSSYCAKNDKSRSEVVRKAIIKFLGIE
jgi:hypothetical protein